MSEIIKTRTLGSSDTSIGTHLALEALFRNELFLYDEKREFEDVDITKYDHHVYNIFTVVRNIINSVTYTNKKDDILLEKDFVNVLKDELSNIAKYYSGKKCEASLFYPNYSDIYKGFNIGKATGDTAVYRQHLAIDGILKKIYKKEKIEAINDLNSYKLPKLKGNVLITTHIACDLFNLNRKVDLLESHTGKLRTKYEYNTKYHSLGQEDLSHLPFIEEVMYILGDKNIVVPCNLMQRRTLLQVSKEFNWNVTTTREKVTFNIKRNKDLRELIMPFKKLY